MAGSALITRSALRFSPTGWVGMRALCVAMLVLMPAIANPQGGAAARAIDSSGGGRVPDARRSGLEFMGPATQALQRDDTQNPAMLWVTDGARRWHEAPVVSSQGVAHRAAGQTPRSCADCHGEVSRSMRAVAARHPAWDPVLGGVVNLQRRINLCRERYQGLSALAPEDDALLALEALLAMQSRGVPIHEPADARLEAALERGRNLFMKPMGQLALSCAQCHDDHAGGRLGGSPIPQAHPTAYPIYRLQWQAVGSLARRLRGCMQGVRAEPFAAMSAEMIELELYLAVRAAGLPHEGPGVRP